MATYTPSGDTELAFGLLVDPPTRQTQQTVSERIITGSNNSVVDVIGKSVTKIRGAARFNSFDGLKTFEGAVGTSGVLVYSEEPGGIDVLFVSLERTRVVSTTDIHLATVEFWLTGPDTLTRRLTLQATVGGVPISNVLSARVSFGFDVRTSQATLVTPVKPGCTYDDVITITLGAGTHDIARFIGLVRDFQYSASPRGVTTICRGWLTRADEYENTDDPQLIAGLSISDLVGTDLATSADIVRAVLDRSATPYEAANIDGTPTLYGETFDPFIWRNGASQDPLIDITDAGETALAYIERYDAVDAVFDAGAGTEGRFSTFETLPDELSNSVYRTLIGGRPWADEDFTFYEGVDILEGQFQRSISDTRNYFLVTGYDYGDGLGPESFALADSNDFQPITTKHTQRTSSPMIERSNDADPGTGMSCETVANALSLEYNREIVKGWLATFRDDALGIGQVHMVRTLSGLPGHLGVGEKLWVQSLDITVDESGFTQRVSYIGGGLPPPELAGVQR
jgi:hypothetical protein